MTKAYQHPSRAGGKRLRPLLTLLCAGAFGGQKAIKIAQNPALALEKIHTYSLVHDDLPCMDNDSLRRGKPTTHTIYGEGKALLVGDALLSEAFLILAKTKIKNTHNINYTACLVQELALSAGAHGMIWGQWLDLSLAGREQLTWKQIKTTHLQKTGKLLGACFTFGLICAVSTLNKSISPQKLHTLYKKIKIAGMLLGLAFQIKDDILDATKSHLELGKTAGKDHAQQKTTAITLFGEKKAEKMCVKYTQQSVTLVKKVLQDPFFTPVNKTKLSFQAELYAQMNLLLCRQK
jgi:geranylgeranyl diphosphate synthase type II